MAPLRPGRPAAVKGAANVTAELLAGSARQSCVYFVEDDEDPPGLVDDAAEPPLMPPLLDVEPAVSLGGVEGEEPLAPGLVVLPVPLELMPPGLELALELEPGAAGVVVVEDDVVEPGELGVVVVEEDDDEGGAPPGTTVVVSLRSHAESAKAPTNSTR